jgi:hypothetical protein
MQRYFQTCSGNPDLFIRLIPVTDDVRDISKLCLVNTSFRDLLFSTLQGRALWLETASLLTGYNGSKVIDIRVSDFQYQLKLLVCPWFSIKVPLFFKMPEFVVRAEQDIRLLNGSRLLFSAYDNGEGDPNLPQFLCFESMPCLSEEKFNAKLAKLPNNIQVCEAPDVDAVVISHKTQSNVVPLFSDENAHGLRYIHKTAFAILDSNRINYGLGCVDGGVYFMSMRNKEKPTILRHMLCDSMEFRLQNDLCSAPQKLWLMNSEKIFYFGPNPIDSTLICDTLIGRMTPAICMASNGDAAGAIAYLRADLRGMDINTPSLLCGRSVLHYAAYSNQPETVRQLIAAGADINQYDSCGTTPLMIAVCVMNLECVRVLCESGADPNKHEEGKPNTIHHLLAEVEGVVSTDLIIGTLSILIQAGVDLQSVDEYGHTVLFNCHIIRDPTILRYLVHQGVDPLHKDRSGNTLLHACFQARDSEYKKHEDLPEVIVKEFGIDVNARF